MKQYAFFFDSSACSGCKACAVACQDKNALPAGLLWRTVREVTGGTWTPSGSAWTTDVFAYYVSSACNHCRQPICVEVCPARALTKRQDGIVLLDSDRCLGCKYCSWACPYDAPRYNARRGRMTKCNMCADLVDAGGMPACVAACPVRCMDFGESGDLEKRFGLVRRVYPLPDDRLTEPALVVMPHASADRAAAGTASAGDGQKPSSGTRDEAALMVFTICAQTAVGATLFLTALASFGVEIGTEVWAPVAFLMFVALVASLFHLGMPLNVWRACANLRTSWLSREILFATLFTAAAVAGMVLLSSAPAAATAICTAIGSLVGLALIVSMANVYRLRTVPEWNTAGTLVSFLTTTWFLGSLFGALLASSIARLPPDVSHTIVRMSALMALLSLTIELAYVLGISSQSRFRYRRARMILGELAAGGLVLALFAPSESVPPTIAAGVCMILALAYVTVARLEHYAVIRDLHVNPPCGRAFFE